MVYALTILLSAGLLFMIQLIMGKVILPWFGGTSSVWTTCMLFFQLVLLAGYAYAHATTRWLSPRGQAWVHRGLMVGALGALGLTAWHWGGPMVPDDSWKPQTVDHPQGSILVLLLVSIGLPFFLLSTTGPLLQRWFSLHGHGEKIYRLYAVSNVGSLLGLVSYPFLVERFLSVPTQAVVWSVGFAVFVSAPCGVRAACPAHRRCQKTTTGTTIRRASVPAGSSSGSFSPWALPPSSFR